jgi:hypothetical protein
MNYVIAHNREKLKRYSESDEQSLRKMKISNPDTNYAEVEIDMYGNNKVSIMSISEKFGLIIESQKIYNTLKSIFDISWKNLK